MLLKFDPFSVADVQLVDKCASKAGISDLKQALS